jgi:hypothetical protein
MVAEDEIALAVDERWETPGEGEATGVERSSWWSGRRGWGGIATDGPFAETKEVIAGYPRVTPAG